MEGQEINVMRDALIKYNCMEIKVPTYKLISKLHMLKFYGCRGSLIIKIPFTESRTPWYGMLTQKKLV